MVCFGRCCKDRNGGLAVIISSIAASSVVLFAGVKSDSDDQSPRPATPAAESDAPADVFGFTMNLIHGAPDRLENYRGEVILIVNVASRCGLTPQYKELQELYEARAADGFIILAFPANNFMG